MVFATGHRESSFPVQILFTDEACFTRYGYFGSRNSHIWDDEIPHAVFIRVHQARFYVNIWGGSLWDYLLGPVIIPGRWNGSAYLEFLQNTLPLLMEEIPLAIRREMWFQHDGAPAHFGLESLDNQSSAKVGADAIFDLSAQFFTIARIGRLTFSLCFYGITASLWHWEESKIYCYVAEGLEHDSMNI